MRIGKKKVLCSAVSATSLIAVLLITLPMTTSPPTLVVRAQPMSTRSPGTYEIDVQGDASGLYMICKLFKEFSANELKWSTSMPTYPPGTNFEAALDVERLDFVQRTHTATQAKYHLSTRELKEALISVPGFVLYVKSTRGELDFVFSDPYYSYYYWTYRTVDIRGKLRGDVVFFIDINNPPYLVSSFHYTGPALTINVHIGT